MRRFFFWRTNRKRKSRTRHLFWSGSNCSKPIHRHINPVARPVAKGKPAGIPVYLARRVAVSDKDALATVDLHLRPVLGGRLKLGVRATLPNVFSRMAESQRCAPPFFRRSMMVPLRVSIREKDADDREIEPRGACRSEFCPGFDISRRRSRRRPRLCGNAARSRRSGQAVQQFELGATLCCITPRNRTKRPKS